jgi:hypothetical protein
MNDVSQDVTPSTTTRIQGEMGYAHSTDGVLGNADRLRTPCAQHGLRFVESQVDREHTNPLLTRLRIR